VARRRSSWFSEIQRVEINNISDRHPRSLVALSNRITTRDFSLAKHCEIKSGAFPVKETLHHAWMIKSNPELEMHRLYRNVLRFEVVDQPHLATIATGATFRLGQIESMLNIMVV
jgi:hypothetical protein